MATPSKIHAREKKALASKNSPFLPESTDITFDHVGGLKVQLQTLKDLIIFPFLQENVYRQYNIKPPRGVIFYGPPGTGKTLVARALATECNKVLSRQGKRVSFYYRNGADFLDKWFGESESKLKTFFEEAKKHSPSIIFLDELDGLAPRRSTNHDHTHTSIVATLLTLMDGLEDLHGVFVIAATNRIEAIDPALRRTGRFDREIHFPLPSFRSRLEILNVHVRSWPVKPKEKLMIHLAEITSGFCGSDLQALCSEAALSYFRRQVASNKRNVRIQQNIRSMRVDECDFYEGFNKISPSAMRNGVFLRRLNKRVQPLLQGQLQKVLGQIRVHWPHFFKLSYTYEMNAKYYAGRVVLVGEPSQGTHSHLAPAVLHALEHMPHFVCDLNTICEQGMQGAEEICLQKFKSAKINSPSVLLLHRIDECWKIVSEGLFTSLLEDLDEGLPILVVATATRLPERLRQLFVQRNATIVHVENPTIRERKQFLYPLFMKRIYARCFPGKTGTKSSASILNLCRRDLDGRKRKHSSLLIVPEKRLKLDPSICLKVDCSANFRALKSDLPAKGMQPKKTESGAGDAQSFKSADPNMHKDKSKILKRKLSVLNEPEKMIFGKITDLYSRAVNLTQDKNLNQMNILYDVLEKIVNSIANPMELLQKIDKTLRQMN